MILSATTSYQRARGRVREWQLRRRAQLLKMSMRVSKFAPDAAANRNWFGRLVISLWVLHLPVIAFLAPHSLLAQTLEKTGTPGFMLAFLSACLAGVGAFDAVVNRFAVSLKTICMMYQRHLGFMLMAALQFISGVGFIHHTHASPVVLLSFWLPASLCVAVTVLDLTARHKEQRECPRPNTP